MTGMSACVRVCVYVCGGVAETGNNAGLRTLAVRMYGEVGLPRTSKAHPTVN